MKAGFCLLLICFLSIQAKSQNYTWSQQTSNTSNQLIEYHFFNNFEGYVCGWNGTILKTLNGGVDWAVYPSPTSLNISAIYFDDVDHGYCSNLIGDIFETDDGALTWTQIFYPSTDSSAADIIRNDGRLFVSREYDVLFSDDDGLTWDSVPLPGGMNLGQKIVFESNTKGYLCGFDGNIATTINNGDSWELVTSLTNFDPLNDIAVISQDKAITVGFSGKILATTDGGVNWFQVATGITSETLWGVDFANGTHGLIVGNADVVLETTDGGLSNWNMTPTGNSSANFFRAYAATTNIAYIFGYPGVIYRSPSGTEDIEGLYYTGPDTVCQGQPFDFSFAFTNVGGGSSFNSEFTVLANGSSLYGNTIAYTGTVNSGDTVVFTVPNTVLNSTGPASIVVFATENNNQGNNTILFDIEVVAPNATYIDGGTFFCPGDTISISATGGNSYYWTEGLMAGADSTQADQDVMPLQTTTYSVEIEQDYCLVTDVITLTQDPMCDTSSVDSTSTTENHFAFSPNFDGVNDILVLDFIDLQASFNNVTIYNRWGDEVFSTNHYDNDQNAWDGSFNNRPAPAGTYFFIAESSSSHSRSGWIQLLK